MPPPLLPDMPDMLVMPGPVWNSKNRLHESTQRVLPAHHIATELNELRLGPVCRHFKPVQASRLNNNVVVVVLPNFGEFGKLNLLSAIIVKFFGVVIHLHNVEHLVAKTGETFVHCFCAAFWQRHYNVLRISSIFLLRHFTTRKSTLLDNRNRTQKWDESPC